MTDRCPACDREYGVERGQCAATHGDGWSVAGMECASIALMRTGSRCQYCGDMVSEPGRVHSRCYDAFAAGAKAAESEADWLATMAEECARQADNPDDDSTLCYLEACRDLLAIVRRHKEQAEAERDQLRKDIAHLTQQAGEDSCADQVRRRIEAEAERDAAMLAHADAVSFRWASDVANHQELVAKLRHLYPEHADRLLAKAD